VECYGVWGDHKSLRDELIAHSPAWSWATAGFRVQNRMARVMSVKFCKLCLSSSAKSVGSFVPMSSGLSTGTADRIHLCLVILLVSSEPEGKKGDSKGRKP
jgi:hypothetical protein